MHHKNIYILALFQEALNILETAVRTFKNQSNEQRLPDAVHAEDIRMLENRKTKLKPDQVCSDHYFFFTYTICATM